MTDLETLRARIDGIDREMMALVGQRLDLCREAAIAKNAAGLALHQPDRENDVRAKFAGLAEAHNFGSEFGRDLYDLILREAMRLEVEVLEANRQPA